MVETFNKQIVKIAKSSEVQAGKKRAATDL